jgi:hypothetical protein
MGTDSSAQRDSSVRSGTRLLDLLVGLSSTCSPTCGERAL